MCVKEVKEPSVPCGVSFPPFFPLLERKAAVGDRTRQQPRRECVSVSGVQMLFLSLSQNLRFCQLPHQREPLRGGEMQEPPRLRALSAKKYSWDTVIAWLGNTFFYTGMASVGTAMISSNIPPDGGSAVSIR